MCNNIIGIYRIDCIAFILFRVLLLTIITVFFLKKTQQ